MSLARRVPLIVPGLLLVAPVIGAQTRVGARLAVRHMHHTTWSADDGMVSLPRGALCQTPDGYLWIGARRALVRFDGVRFTSLDSSASPLLRTDSAGALHPLFVDRDGVMWISRSDGAVLHYANGRFTPAIAPSPGRRPVSTGVQDRSGNIWVTINSALFTVDGGAIRRPRLPKNVPDSAVLSVIPDTGTGVWIGTMRQGLWHVVGDRAERLLIPGGEGNVSRPFLQSSDGRLWIWGPNELMVTDGTSWSTVLADGVNHVAPFRVIESPDHDIWIATQNDGLLRIAGGNVEHYSKRHGLADVAARDVMVDRERNVWVLTDWALERFREAPFVTLGAADGVSFETPGRLVPDEDGSLWIFSISDRNLFHASNGIIDNDTGAVRWSTARFARRGAHHPLGSARGGGVLVWSDSEGVQRIRRGAITTLAHPTQLNATITRALYNDARENLWIGYNVRGTRPGFARVTNGRFTPVAIEQAGQPGSVSAIADDGEGHLWVNNVARPVIYKLSGDSVVARIDSTAGIDAVVTVIATQGVDTLWLLTNRGTLLRAIAGTAKRAQFVGEAAFQSTWSSLVLDDKSLWIATIGGIVRLDLAALHASVDGRGPIPAPRVFDASDGLRSGHTVFTATNAAVADTHGRLWFGTSGGLAVYDPRLERRNVVAPSVHVEEIVVDGRRLADGTTAIPPEPDRVDIHFTAVSLRAPEKARVEYMLDGVDHAWVPASHERVATYTQLRARRYRFRVRAWNEDGVPSVAAADLTFRVVPAWYQTKLFLAAGILAAVAVGPFVVFLVLRQRARTREAELHARFDAALNERTRIARELHDTLLQGFGGITLQLQLVAHTLTTAPAKAADRLERVLRLADNTLVEARHMIWDLRAPELEYQDLSDALASAARDAIVDSPIELRFSVLGNERRLPPLVESTALRVGREATINAARHARANRIEIELAYGERQLHLHVRDDGSGLPEGNGGGHQLNGHWGIAGMRERAARAGGAFEISSEAGVGTTVSLQLPIA